MTDSMFEVSLERQLRDYAEGGVQPFDRYAIAEGLIESGVRRRRLPWLPALGRPILSPSMALVVIGLLLALVAAIVVGALLIRFQLNQPPGRNGLIVYSIGDIAERPYNHLRIINPDGTADREIGQGAAGTYASDGETLTYFTGWGIDSDDLELVQANADGSDPRRVSGYRQTGFYPSPDGSQILLRDPAVDLRADEVTRDWFLLDVATGEMRLLLPQAPETQNYSDFRWAPDAGTIAYAVMQHVTTPDNSGSYRAAIDVVDVASGEVRRLTSRAGTDTAGLAWSPDSRFVVYAGVPDGTPLPSLEGSPESFYPPLDIFVIGADGAGDTNITQTANNDYFPEWSPDQTAVGYVTLRDPSDEGVRLMVQSLRGTKPDGEPLVGPIAASFVWSPDAKLLAYTHSRDVTPPGSDTQKIHSVILTIDRAFEEEPFRVAEFDYAVGSLSWQWLEP